MSALNLSILCNRAISSKHSYYHGVIVNATKLSNALTAGSTIELIKYFHVQSSIFNGLTFRKPIQGGIDQIQNTYQFERFKSMLLDSHKSHSFHTSQLVHNNNENNENNESNEETGEGDDGGEVRDMSKYRPWVEVETSIRYLESEAYNTTYGTEPVWVKYRRNFRGQFAPKLTRPTCLDKRWMITGNPCPICRDEYLVVDYRNVKLLRQFVSPFTDKTLPFSKTCLCQKQQRKMEVAIEKAKLYGLLPFYVPFREYKYEEYFDFEKKKSK